MLPGHLPSVEGVELGMLHNSPDEGGGDLFDIVRVSENTLALLMLHTQGEGTFPLLVSAMARICFSRHIRPGITPFTVIERINEEICDNMPVDLHLSAFLGYLDLHDNELLYCNLGITTPVVYSRSEGSLSILGGHGQSLGESIEEVSGEERVHLDEGDCLMVFTNGFFRMFYGEKTGGEKNVALRFLANRLKTDSASGLLKAVKKRDSRVAFLRDSSEYSFIYAEILTKTRRSLLKRRLGFRKDQIVYLQFLHYLEEMDRTTATILAAMDTAGFPDESIRKMKIVLTELLINALVHGNVGNPVKKVVVGHFVDEKKATVSILDEGKGFDPASIPDPTLAENLEKPCGRGLFIARHYVESIIFNSAGNRVTITKLNR